MSSISASNIPNSTLEPIQDATLELRNGCAALEESLEQIFCELDEMRQELVDRLLAVEQERLRLSNQTDSPQETEETAQLRGELQRQSDELAQAREELARAKQELEQQRNEASDARLAELEAELADAQRRLAASEARGGHASESASDGCAITITAEQMSALEQERDALEAELELVRNRAVELNETVAEQQREISEQKSELSGELQQLRRLVEKQAELFASREDEAPTPAPVAAPGDEPPGANDPVVHSVMAQFAKLQKDVASRRRHRQ